MPSAMDAQPTFAEASVSIVSSSRKFKASDLPLASAVRSAIEGLAHTFKKKGGYDAIRKQAWDKFEASVCSPFYPLQWKHMIYFPPNSCYTIDLVVS